MADGQPQPQPQTSDDLPAIAARYATVAKKAVSDTVKVATDAFDQINATPPKPYGPADAITSLARLADVALSGSLSLARVALQVQPDRRVLLVADNIADSVTSAMSDVLEVARDAALTAESADVSPRQWVKANRQEWVNAAIRLTSIAALRGAEIVETAVAGPGQFGATSIARTFSLASAAASKLSLEVTALKRTDDGNDIKALVVFDPPTLEIGATSFTIKINTVGLPSGTYEGEVNTRKVDGDKAIVGVPYDISIAIPEPPLAPEP
jgi:hypothetical protein